MLRLVCAVSSANLVLSCASVQADTINLQQAFARGAPSVAHVWGRQNVSPISDGVRIRYPEGSIDPGRSPPNPQGGAGFEMHFAEGAPTRTLTYQVRFQQGFQYNKGGKLPGLFGGSAPRGCIKNDADGFSARLMWRADGAGELYLYAPGREAACGDSIGRRNWFFISGTWQTITQKVTMNNPGANDGSIRLFVDGKQVVNADNLMLRNRPDTQVDGLLFSTFFGGSDISWSSPQTQWAEFRNFSFQ